MKSIFKSDYFTEKKIERSYSYDHCKKELIENIIDYETSGIKLKLKEIQLDGIHICIRHEEIVPPFVMEVEHDFPFLKMHFEIEGSSTYTPEKDKGLVVDIPNGHYNFLFLPKVKGTLEYTSKVRNTLEINFTKMYLKRVFGQSFMEASSTFGEAIEKDVPFLMWEKSKPITPRMHTIIGEIIDCKFEGSIKKIYLESKVTEILTIFFNELKNKETLEEKLFEEDYLKIIEAGSIIRNNLKNPPTISELSKITGVNQFKLKHNFKIVFKKPIFSYLTDLRMEKAKQLIVDKFYTVAETAYEVGYKNPQHFTAAFKRKHNYLPSRLKRNRQSTIT